MIGARALQGARRRGGRTRDAVDPHHDLHRGRRAQPRARRSGARWAASGGATGALLGGVLTQPLSWRWIFLVNVPVALVSRRGAAGDRQSASATRTPVATWTSPAPSSVTRASSR